MTRVRRRLSSALLAGIAVVLVGCGNAAAPTVAPAPGATPASSSAPATVAPAAAAGAPVGPGPLPDRPVIGAVSLDIPAIGVHSDPLESLALLPDGSLAPPVDWQSAGWYADGPVPGQAGPAVVAGHIDSTDGPAVFYRLADLVAGDQVRVGLSDGSVVDFTVDRVIAAPKSDFPTQEVYGPTPDAQLRLITCSGTFDRAISHYVDNTIVFATANR